MNTLRVSLTIILLSSTFAIETLPQDSSPPAAHAPAAPAPGTDAPKDWEARAIVGYHQAGASSANFAQNFFFDFFVMRALSNYALYDANTHWNLWGDVRIASAPQQVTTGVGNFISNFSTQVSNVPVNQLAQSADFQTGLEYKIHTFERQNAYRTVGLIDFVGAMGQFQSPSAQMQIFNVPAPNSQQFAAFAAQFPTAANAKYVGFVPPNRERFYRNFGLGVRVATFDKQNPVNPPATYTVSLGEDESITGGIFRSVVGKIDVFYPLPLPAKTSTYQCVYLFGNANLRLSKAANIPTFALQNPNTNGVTVQPFDPNLAVVTVRSTRDTYRIGAGVDLVGLFQSIKGSLNK